MGVQSPSKAPESQFGDSHNVRAHKMRRVSAEPAVLVLDLGHPGSDMRTSVCSPCALLLQAKLTLFPDNGSCCHHVVIFSALGTLSIEDCPAWC